LIKVKTNYSEAKQWILERLGKDQQIGRANGKLKNFIIEPFIPHKDVCIIYAYLLKIN
jgi:ATP citrate (pro-S)-lyase